MTLLARRSLVALAFAAAATLSACGDDDVAGPSLERFRATLAGNEEVPPNTSAATGSAEFTLSKGGDTLYVNINVNALANIRFGHFHTGARGANGPVVTDLVLAPTLVGPQSGRIGRQFVTAGNLVGSLAGQPLSALITQIKAGTIYVNLHTDAFPGGELRGQVAVQ